MKRITGLLISVLAVTGLLGLGQAQTVGALAVSGPQTVASAKTDVCAGAGIAGANCDDKGAGLNTVVKAVLNILSIAVGIAAIIMIIIAGLKYITSAGDTTGIASAKNTLLYAIVGLVIVAFAQVIVRFVLEKAKV